ncbi:MAG: hypothetical protein ACW981_08660 [Candidatus Hodarchaeales archaeon]|jgi:hypothetical protein
MDSEQRFFNKIAQNLSKGDVQISLGKMMSSPGIKYKNKVFAFYNKQKMIFKLGKDFNVEEVGISNYNLLNPLKNNPPLTGWYEISNEDQDKWELLAEMALDMMIKSI